MPIDPPGAPRPPGLTAELAEALAALGPDHRPRTHLLDPDGRPEYVNRLIREASPYLVQHAHNPVDWRPWGAEALAEAAARDVPVFLSVGYATCHWCHVMEEESFDDEEVAAALNAGFVPIKLDREQRPDLDQVYITATQLQQGHAGWPNSVFLRPDGVPFHTGTYFPKPRFLQVLAAVAQAWQTARADIDAVAERMAEAIRRQQAARMADSPPPGAETFSRAADQLAGMTNAAYGGFSEGQQFPQEGFVLFLLDRWRRDGDARALAVAARTLDAIAAGGIHDHAGGGFHRYTVDPNWRTPHFEKMLYNQGLLARAFVEGWEATGRPGWRRAAERCFAYVLRDMTDAEGAFLAAEDADSLDAAGRLSEGAFYVWPADEARALLGEDGAWAVSVLGLEEPWHEVGPVAHLAPGRDVDTDRLDAVLERLRLGRDARVRPLRDDKVIAGWNGLTIRALAEGAEAFGSPDLAAAAARAATALWTRQWDGARLWRLWAGGTAREPGQLDDYAWSGLGFLALAETTGEGRWRDRAVTIAQAMVDAFSDGAGRLRMAAEDGPIGPVYESADGATPAGESSALELLARLGAVGIAEAATAAARLRGALSAQMVEIPLLRPEGLVASRTLDEGRSTLRRTLGGGAVRTRLRPPAVTGGDWMLDLTIAEGWHVTAAESGAGGLEGLALDGARADWPAATELTAPFAERPVRVHEGHIAAAILPDPGAGVLTLSLQSCSDALCLAPERAAFRLPPASLPGMLEA